MSPLDDDKRDRKGVWKSGRGKGRPAPKGRQLVDEALADVRALLGDRPRRRDLLIEHLHLIQDAHGALSAAHLAALAFLGLALPACGWLARRAIRPIRALTGAAPLSACKDPAAC